MAKIQTRRSLSINRALYEQLKTHCAAKNLPMAQELERLVRVELGLSCADAGAEPGPPNSGNVFRDGRWRRPDPVVRETLPLACVASRAQIDQAARDRYRQRNDLPPIDSATFCAICTADVKPPVMREPLGRDGALVVVCTKCSSAPIKPDGQMINRVGSALRWRT